MKLNLSISGIYDEDERSKINPDHAFKDRFTLNKVAWSNNQSAIF